METQALSSEIDLQDSNYENYRSLQLLADGAAWTISTWGHFLVAGVLAFILAEEFGGLITFSWALVLCSIVAWQAQFAKRLKLKPKVSAEQVDQMLSRFSTSAGGVGLLWAVAAGLLFPVEIAELRWFLLFIIGGMSLSAVGTQHVYLPACYASMSIALPCLALRYAMADAWLEAVLLLLYVAVIIRLARMLNRFSIQTIALQRDRDQLLNELLARADELEAARDTAELANVAKSRFLAQASHDLRQPLHAIGLFVETISHGASPDKVERVVGRVRNSLDALSKLFESLLDLSMLDTGQIKVSVEPVSLSALFDRLQREFALKAEESDVTLRFADTEVTVETDESLLSRLTLNLVSNAVRYSAGGSVLIGVRYSGAGAFIEVRDSGIGIDPAEQERIFDEFVRLDNGTSKSSNQGLGLGLAIVRGTADLLGVTVTLLSNPGKGTRFQAGPFTRCAPVSSIQQSDSTPVELTDLLTGLRVLLIDDDTESLDGMTELLRSWRCSVTPTTTLHGLEEADWDVVISDYELGGETYGDQEISKLRKRLPELPGLLVSGSTFPQLTDLARAAGLPLLRKPVRPAQLRSALLHMIVEASDQSRQ